MKPGGRFHIIDMHPTLWIFDDEKVEPVPTVKYSYFGGEALRWEYKGSYAAPDADITSVEHSWQHDFEHIIGALVGAGLRIEVVREYPKVAWQALRFMVKDEDGFWVLPEGMPKLPLMFGLTARKPV